jgi:hypothetical protein
VVVNKPTSSGVTWPDSVLLSEPNKTRKLGIVEIDQWKVVEADWKSR